MVNSTLEGALQNDGDLEPMGKKGTPTGSASLSNSVGMHCAHDSKVVLLVDFIN